MIERSRFEAAILQTDLAAAITSFTDESSSDTTTMRLWKFESEMNNCFDFSSARTFPGNASTDVGVRWRSSLRLSGRRSIIFFRVECRNDFRDDPVELSVNTFPAHIGYNFARRID